MIPPVVLGRPDSLLRSVTMHMGSWATFSAIVQCT